MKKVLMLVIIALFSFTLLNNSNNQETTYLDFDDYDPIEIVKI